MNTLYNSLGPQIIDLHGQLRESWDRLTRIAVALYDPKTETLHTFLNSTVGDSPLMHYEARLDEVPSLQPATQALWQVRTRCLMPS